MTLRTRSVRTLTGAGAGAPIRWATWLFIGLQPRERDLDVRQRRLPTATTAATTTAAVGEIGRPRRLRLVKPALFVEPGRAVHCVGRVLVASHSRVLHYADLELVG